MPSIALASLKELADYAGLLGLFAFDDGSAAGAAFLSNAEKKALTAALKDEDFRGKAGEVASLRITAGGRERRLLVAGLGSRKSFTSDSLRKSAAALYRAAKKRAKEMWVAPHASTQVVVEGLRLAAYQNIQYRAGCKETILETVKVLFATPADKRKAEGEIERGQIYADSVCWVRDLVNLAPSDKSPERMTELAQKEFAGTGIKVKVIDQKEAEKMGMGSYLGVARGSARPPFFLHLTYSPKQKAKRRIGLVGKGITFDSGGLSLKTAVGMETMKMDMAGAATVFGVFKALAKLKVKAEVHGFTPFAYNMPGPDAVKPGDVLKAMNGKTIEVLNTDAEGRLILADALVYAGKQKLDAIIDLATLTGAAIVALGNDVTAAMANDKKLLQQLFAASKKTNEEIWELPLYKPYRESIKSKVADLKNIGAPGQAGTIIGGLFLQEFVEEKQPWVHLDIAGPAWTDGGNGTCVPGGTGAMTRTLLEYLQAL